MLLSRGGRLQAAEWSHQLPPMAPTKNADHGVRVGAPASLYFGLWLSKRLFDARLCRQLVLSALGRKGGKQRHVGLRSDCQLPNSELWSQTANGSDVPL